MNKLALFNIAAVVVPITCLVVAGGVAYRQVQRINQLHEMRVQVEKNIAFVESIQRELDHQPPLPRFPTVEQSPREQPDFLNTLRMFAAAAAVRLVRYANATPIAPSTASATPSGQGEPNGKTLPAGVLPIASTVEVSGRYAGVRAFLYALQRSPRLFNLSDIRWTAAPEKWPLTVTSFTLTRYVTPAVGGATVGGDAASPPQRTETDTNLVTSPGRRLGPSAPSTLPAGTDRSGTDR